MSHTESFSPSPAPGGFAGTQPKASQPPARSLLPSPKARNRAERAETVELVKRPPELTLSNRCMNSGDQRAGNRDYK